MFISGQHPVVLAVCRLKRLCFALRRSTVSELPRVWPTKLLLGAYLLVSSMLNSNFQSPSPNKCKHNNADEFRGQSVTLLQRMEI